jgi:ABC-type dipeptide/oligopeptide/nickel transport system permease subunit
VPSGFGFLNVVVSVLVGGLLGLTAGFFGGWWDRLVLRFVDILMALPSLLLAIVVVAVLVHERVASQESSQPQTPVVPHAARRTAAARRERRIRYTRPP